MSFTSGVGSLLGGATEEAGKIRAERFQKEMADMNMASSMLQHIIDNPDIKDPAIKAHAQGAYRDLVMSHLFPDQFKKDKKNPVSKLVDQFIGQSDNSAGMAGSMNELSQIGVGRGNAKNEVGGASPMGPPPAPPQMGQSPSSMAGSVPPPPPSMGGGQTSGTSVPTNEWGFADPQATKRADLQMTGQVQNQQYMDLTKQQMTQLTQSPAYQAADPQQQAQMVAGVLHTQFTAHYPDTVFLDEYDPQQGQTVQVGYKKNTDGTLERLPGPGIVKPPAAEQQAIDQISNTYANLESKDNPYKGLKASQISGLIRMQKLEDEKADAQAKLKLTKAESEYYESVKNDPFAQQQVSNAFSSVTGAANDARGIIAEWMKTPTVQVVSDGTIKGPDGKIVPAGGYVAMSRVVDNTTFGKLYKQALKDRALGLGMSVEDMLSIVKTGKPGAIPKGFLDSDVLPEGKNSLGLDPPTGGADIGKGSNLLDSLWNPLYGAGRELGKAGGRGGARVLRGGVIEPPTSVIGPNK